MQSHQWQSQQTLTHSLFLARCSAELDRWLLWAQILHALHSCSSWLLILRLVASIMGRVDCQQAYLIISQGLLKAFGVTLGVQIMLSAAIPPLQC